MTTNCQGLGHAGCGVCDACSPRSERTLPDGYVAVPVEPTEEMLAATVDERGTPRILDFTSPEERDQPFLMARFSYRAMLSAAPSGSGASEPAQEVQFEVWEDDMMVASSTDEADARHYLAVYSQDGPVRLVRAVTVRSPMSSDPTTQPGSDATQADEA